MIWKQHKNLIGILAASLLSLTIIIWTYVEVVRQPDLGMLWTDVGIVYYASPNSPFEIGDYLISLDGDPFSDSEFPYFFWQQGDIIEIVLERNDGLITERISYDDPAPSLILLKRSLLFFVVLTFWAVSSWIGLFAPPDDRQSLLFFVFCQLLGVSLALGSVTSVTFSAHLSVMLTSFSVAAALHFHMRFPINRVGPIGQKLIVAFYGVATLFSARFLIVFGVVPFRSRFSQIYSMLFSIWALIGIGAIFYLLYSAYRNAPTSNVRRQVGIVTLSGMLAFMPLFTFSLIPQILIGNPLMPPEVAFIFLIFLPLGYGYAIKHYQSARLERYMSRNTTAVYVAGFLFVLYLGINAGMQFALDRNFIGGNPISYAFVILILALIFNPIHQAARNFVDFLLYGGWYDYPSVVGDISSNLRLVEHDTGIEDIVKTLSTSIQANMRVYWVCLLWQGRESNHTVVSTVGQPNVIPGKIKMKSLPNITGYLQVHCQPIMNQKLHKSLSKEHLSSEEKALLNDPSVRLWVPIRGLENSLGLFILGSKYGGESFNEDDLNILDMVGRQASMTFQNVQLVNELKQTAHENEQYKKEIIRTREVERKRLSRELHDQVIQALVGLKYELVHLSEETPVGIGRSNAHLDNKHEMLQTEIGNLIQITRLLCQDLRPTALNLGLIPSIRSLISRFERHSETAVNLHLEGNRSQKIDEGVALCIYRCAGETLQNITKHAQATLVTLKLSVFPTKVVLSVNDNGQGFTVPERLGSLMTDKHFGLVGMRERVELLQGNFFIHSAPGQGTYLRVSIPLSPACQLELEEQQDEKQSSRQFSQDPHPVGR